MARKTKTMAGAKLTGKEHTAGFPPLGRALLWVDKPGSASKLFWALAVLCGVLFLLDFAFEHHGHFVIENWPGFFGIYGFVMFTLLILVAKALRFFIKRPEDFYCDKAIDREAYPGDQLERKRFDA